MQKSMPLKGLATVFLLLCTLHFALNAGEIYYAPLSKTVSVGERQLCARLRPDTNKTDFEKFCGDNGWSAKEKIKSLSIYLVKTTDDDYAGNIQKLESSGLVIYAEPNFEVRASSAPAEYSVFKDTGSQVWGLEKIGARAAWDITRGEGILVAVIDTGISLTHLDFSSSPLTSSFTSAIFINQGEYKFGFDISKSTFPENFDGVDNDGNGIVDDVIGYNFTYDDSKDFNPATNSPLPVDNDGHGTHVSGIIAARQNNNVGALGVQPAFGISGIAPLSKILPVKALNPRGTALDIAAAIVYAADMKAKVINMSLGGDSSQVEKNAVDYAFQKDVVIVAAAGNSYNETLDFPAGFTNVISVGAINRSGFKTGFSNYGVGLDIVAPGDEIYSTLPNNLFGSMSGTSMASPYIAGIAALILSANPGLSPKEVQDRIIGSTGRTYWNFTEGWGTVNASLALTNPKQLSALYEPKVFNYPNPFELSKYAFTTIKTPADFRGKKFTVRIFNLAGEQVRKLTENTQGTSADDGLAVWDGRNADGYYVSSGLYLYSVECDNKKANGKITFIK